MITFLAIAILFAAQVAQAAQQPLPPREFEMPPPKMYVVLSVSSDEDTKNRILTTMRRQLRQLRDVEVIESDETKPDTSWLYNLSIIAIEEKNGLGQPVGLALSILASEPLNVKKVGNDLKRKLADETAIDNIIAKKELKDITLSDFLLSMSLSRHERVLSHSLRIGSPGNLQQICEEIVAKFDSDWLENTRRAYREVNEDLKSRGLLKP